MHALPTLRLCPCAHPVLWGKPGDQPLRGIGMGKAWQSDRHAQTIHRSRGGGGGGSNKLVYDCTQCVTSTAGLPAATTQRLELAWEPDTTTTPAFSATMVLPTPSTGAPVTRHNTMAASGRAWGGQGEDSRQGITANTLACEE